MPEFDFSTLITDRSASDLELLRDLLSTPMSDWTAEQFAAFNLAASKGAYNYTDLNRVTACMDYLNERLTALGYVTGYQRLVVHPEEPPGPVGPLPDGYTELEYIQSSGDQYINSGYAPNQNTRVVADGQLMGQTTASVGFFGVRDTVAVNSPNKFIAWSMATGQSIRSDYFGTSSSPTSSISVVGKRITINKNRNICSFGETVLTNTVATGQCQNNMFLFAENDGGKANYFGSIKLYSCQVYDNDNLIRDFIPCVNSEGAVGLYDMVGAQFYGNAGSGTFTAGPEVPQPEPEPTLDPYIWYEADTPRAYQTSRYLQNVSKLRAALTLPEGTLEVPDDMTGMTQAEANAIEGVLGIINDYLEAMQRIFLRSGMAWAISGGPNYYFAN